MNPPMWVRYALWLGSAVCLVLSALVLDDRRDRALAGAGFIVLSAAPLFMYESDEPPRHRTRQMVVAACAVVAVLAGVWLWAW